MQHIEHAHARKYSFPFVMQVAISGVSPLVTKVLNAENPAPVVVCGTTGHVNAVCDKLTEESAPNTIYRYTTTQFWPVEHATAAYKYLFNATSISLLSTVPLENKVSGHCLLMCLAVMPLLYLNA